MSVLQAFIVVGLIVFLTSEFSFADPTYGKVGDSAVLKPDQTSGPITSVTWKHQTDLALEWLGGEITYYRTFKGRCDLDKATGSFTIRNLAQEDSGEYTPEINHRVLSKKELILIKPVPKPAVSVDCNNEKTVCNLTCEAVITSEFEPVTYEWKAEDTVLSTNEELSLTTKNEESSFFCILRNPVSNSTSDDFPNPISRGNSDTTVIVLVPLLLGFAVIVIGAVFLNRAGHLPFLDKIFPCNEKARNGAADARQDVNVEVPLLTIENETNQDQAAETPNGRLHEENNSMKQQQDAPTDQVSDDKGEPEQNSYSEEPEPTAEEPGKPDDSTCNPSVDTQPEQEINSKSKEALNGHQLANTNEDDSMKQQQDAPTDQVSDDKGEPEQNSYSEEPEPTAEEPGKPDDSTCNPSVDTQPEQEINSKSKEALNGHQLANTNEDDSMKQQQDAPTDQVSDDKGEPEQNSYSEEPEPTAEEPGKPDDSTCNPSVDTQPEQEINSKSKEALNGHQLANTNEDDSMKQQQDAPTDQDSDDKGEPEQNSYSEEPEPTAEEPETSPPESSREETPDTDPAES